MEGLALIVALLAVATLLVTTWLLNGRLLAAQRQTRTAQRELEKSRQEIESLRGQLNSVSDSLAEGLVLIDGQKRITYLNRAAQAIFHLSDGINQSFDEIAWGWDLQPPIEAVLARRAEMLSQTIVKEDRAFQVIVRALLSGSASGAAGSASGAASFASGAAIVLSEVTELQRLGRVRRDFVANISHDLRTPVTTAGLLADTLATELQDAPPLIVNMLTKLRGQIDVLHQLTYELMDLALIESGQMPIKLVDVSVADLVAQAQGLFQPQAERKQIALDVQVSQDLRVLADPEGVRKVLSNLLHNAIKFTPPNGHVTVSAHGVDDSVEVQIQDSGIGIPARDLPRVFERFYKVDRSRVQGAETTRSTGLGLAIAKHIVEGHGGTIRVESTEGRGSTFYFTLPSAN